MNNVNESTKKKKMDVRQMMPIYVSTIEKEMNNEMRMMKHLN